MAPKMGLTPMRKKRRRPKCIAEELLTPRPKKKRVWRKDLLSDDSDDSAGSYAETIEKSEEYLESDEEILGDNGEVAGPSNRMVHRTDELNDMGTTPSPPKSAGQGKEELREAFQKTVIEMRPFETTREHLTPWIETLPAKFKKLVIFSIGQFAHEMFDASLEAVDDYIKIARTIIITPPSVPNHLKVDAADQTKISIHKGTRERSRGPMSCVKGSKAILETIIELDSENTMFLFLTSAGAEELFCCPQGEMDMEQKRKALERIRKAGATPEHMRICRARLSAIRGDKLTRFIQQGSAHTLIISTAYAGPIRYEQCGVMETRAAHVVQYSVPEILRQLGLNEDKIEPVAFEALHAPEERDLFHYHNDSFTTSMVSSNHAFLQAISANLTAMGYDAHIMNRVLADGSLSTARQFSRLLTRKITDGNYLTDGERFEFRFPLALIFGGKLHARRDEMRDTGGPNLNLVRNVLDYLTVDPERPRYEFTFLSASTSGVDQISEAGGALIGNDDVPKARDHKKLPFVKDAMQYWDEFRNGANLMYAAHGREEMDLLDVQVLLLHRELRPGRGRKRRRSPEPMDYDGLDYSPEPMSDLRPGPSRRPHRGLSLSPRRPRSGMSNGTHSRLHSPMGLRSPRADSRLSRGSSHLGSADTSPIPSSVARGIPMNYDQGCGNCRKTDDVKFRRIDDAILCNACWLYYKKNGRHRPPFLFQTRSRAESMPKSLRNSKSSK